MMWSGVVSSGITWPKKSCS